MSQFEAREEKDGVRLSWNVLPRSKFQHQRNVVPFGSMYTPLNNKSEFQLLAPNAMVTCRQCYAVLNPYAFINNNLWTCQFCSYTNQLPPTIQPGTIHPAQDQDATTIEYLTGKSSQLPPIFFFVVDTCFEDEDVTDAFASLKESLIISLSLLPENALIGFISYGKHVQIHDLLSNDIKSFTFNGNKEYTLDQISKSLGLLAQGLSSHNDSNGYTSVDRVIGPIGRRFLQPVSLVEYQLTNIIENLIPNSFPHSKSSERLDRATGSAINIASLLLKSILGDHITTTGGHILCFIGGMATFGPGKIVNRVLKEPLRSHHDIERLEHSTLPQAPTTSTKTKADTSLFTKAKKFYHGITKTLIGLGLSCNFFIGSYNQVGLFEMDEICYKTGGTVVMSDSFNTAIFKQSFIKFFKKQQDDSEALDMGFNASLEVKSCPDLKIQGLIGNATAIPPIRITDEKYLSTYILGESGTNCWKLCNVNPQSTYAIYFDKVNSNVLGFTYIQFLFHYQHANGEMRLRVTTVPINIVSDTDMATLERGFDQEAALVLIARDAINKLQPGNFNTAADSKKTTTSQKSQTIIKNLDQMLINYCTRFAVYTVGVFESFRLSASYSMLPQFLFHLRRSQFINVFGNSPDETSYIRHVFMHEDVNNSLLMVQPLLLSYDIDAFGAVVDEETGAVNNEPVPALLDSASLGSSKILLLDTFFHILIHHGSTVAQWRKAGYQDLPEYEHFKQFLEAPKKEAMEILMDRFPLPRFIDCDEGGSQARFLMAKLNPSTSYATNPNHLTGIGQRFDVFTDDTNLQAYMSHIQKNVISQK